MGPKSQNLRYQGACYQRCAAGGALSAERTTTAPPPRRPPPSAHCLRRARPQWRPGQRGAGARSPRAGPGAVRSEPPGLPGWYLRGARLSEPSALMASPSVASSMRGLLMLAVSQLD